MTAERRRAWLAATPALAVLMGGAAATGLVALTPASLRPDTLAAQATQDVAVGDYARAELRYQHLMALRPDRPDYALALADVLNADHRRSAAMAVLAVVAPPDADGYGPAHVRQAEWLIEAHVFGYDEGNDTLALARRHLDHPFADDATRRRAAELRNVLDADDADMK